MRAFSGVGPIRDSFHGKEAGVRIDTALDKGIGWSKRDNKSDTSIVVSLFLFKSCMESDSSVSDRESQIFDSARLSEASAGQDEYVRVPRAMLDQILMKQAQLQHEVNELRDRVAQLTSDYRQLTHNFRLFQYALSN